MKFIFCGYSFDGAHFGWLLGSFCSNNSVKTMLITDSIFKSLTDPFNLTLNHQLNLSLTQFKAHSLSHPHNS